MIKILFLHSSENRPFRIGGGANMERVVRMDREMTKVSCAIFKFVFYFKNELND